MRAVRIKRPLTFREFSDWGPTEAGKLGRDMLGARSVTLMPGLVDLGMLRDYCASIRAENARRRASKNASWLSVLSPQRR